MAPSGTTGTAGSRPFTRPADHEHDSLRRGDLGQLHGYERDCESLFDQILLVGDTVGADVRGLFAERRFAVASEVRNAADVRCDDWATK